MASLSEVRTSNPAPRKVERRAAVRFPSDKRATCQPLRGNKDDQWIAQLHDVSVVGVGVVVPRPFQPGTALTLEVSTEAADYKFLMKVVRTEVRSPGHWLLGCVFARALSEEELQNLTLNG